ncbi:hypothetical protein ON010_g10834 [Phytophthora cinnamomi]|nr:hypothetical protein ON010_g10834 [Phytophthora cinnamomi]
MDAILQYASSPSPPSSPTESVHPPALVTTRPIPSTAPPVATCDEEKRRQLVAERLAGQRRTIAHRSTREEDAFRFRGYAVKRRRRQPPSPVAASNEAVNDGPNTDLSLFNRDEASASMPTADFEPNRVIPLLKRDRQRFVGHSKAINELQWHPQHPDLFLSSSMDATVRVWKCSAEGLERSRRVFTHHSLGVRRARWSLDGKQILSGGYDGLACCVDAETGQTQQELRRPDTRIPSARIERITSACFHPFDPNSLLLGTDQGCIYGHDLREKSPQQQPTTYTKSFGDVHDLLFLGDDGQRFVSSAGVLHRDSSNQTLLVWDWRSATLLYDRLDSNMLAHPCLRAHPNRPYFIAQCSGSYATLYSSKSPYKCLKGPTIGGHRPPLRFSGGHQVDGYNIQCSFTPDGEFWATGDSSGRVAIYRTAGKRELMESFQVYGHRTACITAEYQPTDINSSPTLLTGSSVGDIDLLQ